VLCLCVGEPGFRRAQIGFDAAPFFGSRARLQGAKPDPTLFQLGLQRSLAGLELFLTQLGNEIAFGNPLTFPNREPDQKSGNLERKFGLLRSLRPAGKSAGMKFATRSENNCFHRTHRLRGMLWLTRATADNKKKSKEKGQDRSALHFHFMR